MSETWGHHRRSQHEVRGGRGIPQGPSRVGSDLVRRGCCGVGVHNKEESSEEVFVPGRGGRKSDVQINTGDNDISQATIEDYGSAVTCAQVRDLLRFEGAGRVHGSTWIGRVRWEDVKTLRPREAVPN